MPDLARTTTATRRVLWGTVACTAALGAGVLLGGLDPSAGRAPAPQVHTVTARIVQTAEFPRVRTWTMAPEGDLADGWLPPSLFTPGVYDGVIVDSDYVCGWLVLRESGPEQAGSGSPTALVTIPEDAIGFSSRNCFWRRRP